MVKLTGCLSAIRICLRCGHDDRGPIASTGLCRKCGGDVPDTAKPTAKWGVQSYSVFHTIQAKGGKPGQRVQVGTYATKEEAQQAAEAMATRQGKRPGAELKPMSYGYLVRVGRRELHHYSIQLGVRDRTTHHTYHGRGGGLSQDTTATRPASELQADPNLPIRDLEDVEMPA